MKNLTNKFRLWSVLLVGSGMFALTSCGNGELTKGKAEDALEEGLLMFQDNSQYENIPVGYFQLDNESARASLKQLADVGLITYKVDKVIEKKRISNYSWYSGTSYSYRDVDHYFVTLALTPEGQKFVIDEPVTELIDEDMVNKKAEQEEVSPQSVLAAADSVRIADSIAAVEAAAAEMAEENPPLNQVKPDAPKEKSAYELAVDKVNMTSVCVRTHKNKIVKVKNVFCPEDMLKEGKATCEYIYEYSKVTPFGRILDKLVEGDRHKGTASFVHYIDRGWCVAK